MSPFSSTALRNPLPDSSANPLASIEGIIATVFRDPERPKLSPVDTIHYGSDGFEAQVSTAEGFRTGRYITFENRFNTANPKEPVHYNVSGTGPNGEYIPPHQVDAKGRVKANTGAPSEFRIRDELKMIALLELRPGGNDPDGRTFYTREGFTGKYYLQTESGGALSVHYTGGPHRSGVPLPPQTFVNGSWDLSRTQPLKARELLLPSIVVGREDFGRRD